MKTAARRAKADEIRGHRAGLISRLLAGGVDLLIVSALVFGVFVAVGVVEYMLGSGTLRLPDAGPLVTIAAFPVVEIIYLTTAWSVTGRSVGKELIGLRVVRARGGGALGLRRAFARAVVVTFFAGPSLLWAAVSHRNAAVHDIVLRTAVVYDWADAAPRSAPPVVASDQADRSGASATAGSA